MLADEALDAVSVRSGWRSSRRCPLETRACQTSRVPTAEAEVPALSTAEAGSQTEAESAEQPQPDGAEPDGLQEFLGRVEAAVVQQLVRNSRSRAFHGFQVRWEDPSEQVSLRHCLQHPGAVERKLQVTKVSWSCTGAVLACAYGRLEEGDWSTETAHVCTWNLRSPKLKPRQPEAVIEAAGAVSALSCHPTHAALLAGGLYSGRVVVWDTGRTDQPVLAQTGICAAGHREPVCEVVWVPQQRRADFSVLSACSQGKVLLWRLEAEQRALVLSAAFSLDPEQIPRSLKVRACGAVGLTSLAVSSWDWDTVLVGSEGGLLLRCSLPSPGGSTAPPRGPGPAPAAPPLFSFRRSSGPVYSIHPSPFHWSLFVSAGTDGLAHLHSLQQSEPLLSLRVGPSYVLQVQWSPSRPLVFAAATAEGPVQVFDLGRRSPRPAATLEGGGAGGGAATSLAFNSQNPELLAVGRADGSVDVWHLSSQLTERRPREAEQLRQMADQGAA